MMFVAFEVKLEMLFIRRKNYLQTWTEINKEIRLNSLV